MSIRKKYVPIGVIVPVQRYEMDGTPVPQIDQKTQQHKLVPVFKQQLVDNNKYG